MHLPDPTREKVEQIYQRIQQQPVGRYFINDLAKEARLAPEVFNQTFKHLYGITVPECIVRAKMQLAARLLLQGMPIKQVAADLQYRQVINFHKTFKRVMGLTPGQYCSAHRRR